MKQIHDDAEDEIKQISSKNETAINQVSDMSLRSKAELSSTKNKLAEVSSEIEHLSRQIDEKNVQLDNQKKNIEELKKTW